MAFGYFISSICNIVTPLNRPYESFSAFRQTRIETIQGRPPGTFVRVENEVIPLHNSP